MPPSTASILLVDDDPDICLALGDFLVHQGYHIETAPRGQDAIAKAQTCRFDAALLDLGLPDMDGLLVLKALTERDPDLPIIILSALVAEEKASEALRRGAFAYLRKPYNREEVQATLVRAIGIKALTTQAQAVERALSRSEERFQSVVQVALDAIVVTDSEGHLLSWNQAAHDLFGYSETEAMGKPLTFLLPERYHAASRKWLGEAEPPDQLLLEERRREIHGRKKSGAEFPAELTIGPWKTEEGIFSSCIVRDLTERKRSEQVQSQLAAIVESSNDPIISNSLDGTIVTWNAAAERLYGYTAEEAKGSPIAILAPADRADEVPRMLARLRAGEIVQAYETVRRRKDGTFVDVSLTLSPIRNARGEVTGMSGIVRDITERKRAEALLRRQQIEQQVLLDLIPAMVWYKDDQNRILRANRRAAESIGRSVAEIEGQSTYTLYPEEAEKYYQDDVSVLQSGQPKLGIVELLTTGSAAKRWVQTDKVPYRDEDGRIMGVLVFAQDITERKRAEEQLARYRQIFTHSINGISILDLEGRYLEQNAAHAALMGYSDEDLSGQTPAIHLGEALFTRVFQTVKAHGSYDGVVFSHTKTGQLKKIALSAFTIKDSDGSPVCYVGIKREV